MKSKLTLTICLLALAGCQSHPSLPAHTVEPSSPAVAASAAANGTDAWLGRWNGPEGTYLQLSKVGDHYTVEIRDLDGSRTFIGYPADGRIRFVRDGKTEFLSAGNGEAAGMKWLLDKKHCLLTRQGEGWCRD